jgi:hypothetical protein
MKRSDAIYHAKQAHRLMMTNGIMSSGFTRFLGGKFGGMDECEFTYVTGDDGTTLWHVYMKTNGAVIKTLQTDMSGHPLVIK